MNARNAHREARDLVDGGGRAWVLEPSPPAVADATWFADDPWPRATCPGRTGCAGIPATRTGPPSAGSAPTVACPARRRRSPRRGWPCTAWPFYVVSPARRRANGKIGLRWTLGGVGTPFFGDDEQVRVQGSALVRQRGGEAVSEPITTLARAAAARPRRPSRRRVRPRARRPGARATPTRPCPSTPRPAAFLGDWFGFAWSVLEEVRADPASAPTGRVQLWPEHFDAAFDGLPEDSGRATFGASPGDAGVPRALPLRPGRRRAERGPAERPGRRRRPARGRAGLLPGPPRAARRRVRRLLPDPVDPVDPAEVYADRPAAAGRPAVRLNMIASVDGAAAGARALRGAGRPRRPPGLRRPALAGRRRAGRRRDGPRRALRAHRAAGRRPSPWSRAPWTWTGTRRSSPRPACARSCSPWPPRRPSAATAPPRWPT